MSVGHAARLFEEAGITTVIIAVKAFEEVVRSMCLPRVLLTDHPMGRPVGPPMDLEYQTRVVSAALTMIEECTQPGSVQYFDGRYLPGQNG
jgi:hypothetical protein